MEPGPAVKPPLVILGQYLQTSMLVVRITPDCSTFVVVFVRYARQVAEFFEYVQQTKDTESGTGNQLVLPRSGGLLGPDGAHLLGNLPLDAADLSRRMSSLCV